LTDYRNKSNQPTEGRKARR